MRTINGVFTSATIFTTTNNQTNIDEYALAQLQMLCDNEASKGCKIRVMPDVHPGKVGTIGLTMTIGERILPNLVGIDIGCGMTMAQINTKRIEYQKLDTVIREKVPSGTYIHSKAHLSAAFDFTSLCCFQNIRQDKAVLSLGTLGGGNHFIEIDQEDDGSYYAVIHSGSRHLGKEVTEYYLREGQKQLKEGGIDIPYELTYLEGELKEQYLNDLQIVQNYAALNRELILEALAKGMKWKITDTSSCIHNYVEAADTSYNELPILRKGAISAKKGENVIIPINMRDGIILGTGLGNEAWNCSAPHGAGRIMKREDVKSHFTLSAFKTEMKGIYSSCVNKETLDEAPFAYRRLDEISEVIKETVTINKIIRPVYNFKASGN
ncbi:MAG: RNA-splicing ligase RtcB [Anaerocolumna sp.]|nr:RNA-splicing ligase RtcB [Anaerocolumna sp.]